MENKYQLIDLNTWDNRFARPLHIQPGYNIGIVIGVKGRKLRCNFSNNDPHNYKLNNYVINYTVLNNLLTNNIAKYDHYRPFIYISGDKMNYLYEELERNGDVEDNNDVISIEFLLELGELGG